MDTRLAAVVQDVGIVAAGVFEGVGEDGQTVEGAFIVDRLREGRHGGGEPGGIDGHGTERVAEWAARVSGVPVRLSADAGPPAAPGPRTVLVGTAAAVKDVGPVRLDLVAILDVIKQVVPKILAGLKATKDFDANGWMGKKDLHGFSNCQVIMQIQGGKFVRVFPKERGTLDCNAANEVSIMLDPVAEAAKLK